MALVVAIELWPGGDKSRKLTKATMIIANDGTGTKTVGNYDVTLLNRNGAIHKRGRVEKWPRQARSVWGLFERALQAVYPGTTETAEDVEAWQ